MNQSLVGYWANDVWNVMECPFLNKEYTRPVKNLFFDKIDNLKVRREFKFYFYICLNDHGLSVNTLWENATFLSILGQFISKYYPTINSIIDVPQQKFLLEYKTFLLENGRPIENVRNIQKVMPWKSPTIVASPYITMYQRIYDYFYNFYDDREETEKDRWDIRKLNIDYNKTQSRHFIDFSMIAQPFREQFKKYIKNRLIIQKTISWSRACTYLCKLPLFFKFIKEKHPSWKDLKLLSRADIENFIEYLRSTPMGGNSTKRGSIPNENHIFQTLEQLETYISYIQRFDWDEAPSKSIKLLIFSEDKPKQQKRKPSDIKCIPDDVWNQVINHIHKLPSEYVPILLLMEASGFRVCDILSLKMDCLVNQEDGWWLVGDQRKVKYKNHKIPIDDEIAKVIMAQQTLIKKISTLETNPENYLFPRLKGKRKGKPIPQSVFEVNLNKLAHKCNILDKNGEVYWFRNHAFRHRYGVNLINNGMNILHVQKLMAHASPEMTLVYAQIHDATLRKEWEKARENGAVRLDTSGKVIAADLDQQAQENGLELEWIRHNMDSIRLDHGFCIKHPKTPCSFLEQTLEPPCIKNNCRSLHIDTTFLPYYQEQISKMESDIKIYIKTGRIRSVELIEPKLKRYKELAKALEDTGGILGIIKSKREYVGEERERVKQNG